VTWIRDSLADAMRGYPDDYRSPRRDLRRVPANVARDSIVLSCSLVPEAMRTFFAGYGALLDPKLPLSRKQHEMIATVVSRANDCFY
jgi:hypothetical protein